MLDSPVGSQLLCFGDLFRCHFALNPGDASVCAGKRKPHVSLDIVLRSSVTLCIEIPQIVSSLPGAAEIGHMLGGFTKPVRRLDIVLFNAITVLVADSQFILGIR